MSAPLGYARDLTGREPAFDLAEVFARRRAEFGDLRMEGEGGAGAGTGGGAGSNEGGGSKTYDEAHVQRVAAQQKAEGERAALARAAEALGMSVEDAKKKLEAAEKAEREAMGEADRKVAEAADREKAAQAKEAAATRAQIDAKITQQLLVHGVDLGPQDAKDDERAERLAIAARMVSVADNADDAAIKAAVERVKAMVPQLFVETKPAGNGAGPPDSGRGPNGGRQQDAGPFGKEGVDEFDRRFPKKQPAAAGT